MSNPIEKLVHELAKLPSVGHKTALRLTLHILRQAPEYGLSLAKALQETIGRVRFCQQCQNICLQELCDICLVPHRDATQICVVEDIADLRAIEDSRSFKGMYHVLHGALSPIDGVGPDQIRIAELLKRLESNSGIREIILATNPNVTGEATALYISRLIKKFAIKTTRLASGIPVGGHLEYIDHNTISRALEYRAEF